MSEQIKVCRTIFEMMEHGDHSGWVRNTDHQSTVDALTAELAELKKQRRNWLDNDLQAQALVEQEQEIENLHAEVARLRAQVERFLCGTCHGHGLVGHHERDGSYDAWVCPDCLGSGRKQPASGAVVPDFDTIENSFPEGMPFFIDDDGDAHTNAQWLHEFARNVTAAMLAAAPEAKEKK